MEKKKNLTKEFEDSMACSAFAEEGEPCLAGAEDQKTEPDAAGKSQKKKKTTAREIEDTMACSAFAEAGEPCPIDQEEKNEKPAGE